MRILRKKLERSSNSEEGETQFAYMSTNGSLGTQAMRMQKVKGSLVPKDIIETLEEALQNGFERVYRDGEGYILTAGRILNALGWAASHKYMLILENLQKDLYVVFYVKANRRVTWVAGPELYDFSEVWRRFELLSTGCLH